eukprot:4651425-Amphidinium_carterae.1
MLCTTSKPDAIDAASKFMPMGGRFTNSVVSVTSLARTSPGENAFRKLPGEEMTQPDLSGLSDWIRPQHAAARAFPVWAGAELVALFLRSRLVRDRCGG